MKAINPKARSWPLLASVFLLVLLATLGVGGRAQAQERSIGLLEKASAGKFQPGYYTTSDGRRHAGSIRVWHDPQRNLLQVDQGKQATPLNLAPAELRSVVMGRDSLIVVRRFHHLDATEPLLSGQPDFCRVKMSGKIQVLEHERLVIVNNAPTMGAGGMMSGGGRQKILQVTWLLRTPTDTTLYVVPTSPAAFGRATAPLFVDYPALCQQMTAGYVGPDDFKRIIYSYIFKREIGQVSYEAAASIFR